MVRRVIRSSRVRVIAEAPNKQIQVVAKGMSFKDKQDSQEIFVDRNIPFDKVMGKREIEWEIKDAGFQKFWFERKEVQESDDYSMSITVYAFDNKVMDWVEVVRLYRCVVEEVGPEFQTNNPTKTDVKGTCLEEPKVVRPEYTEEINE